MKGHQPGATSAPAGVLLAAIAGICLFLSLIWIFYSPAEQVQATSCSGTNPAASFSRTDLIGGSGGTGANAFYNNYVTTALYRDFENNDEIEFVFTRISTGDYELYYLINGDFTLNTGSIGITGTHSPLGYHGQIVQANGSLVNWTGGSSTPTTWNFITNFRAVTPTTVTVQCHWEIARYWYQASDRSFLRNNPNIPSNATDRTAARGKCSDARWLNITRCQYEGETWTLRPSNDDDKDPTTACSDAAWLNEARCIYQGDTWKTGLYDKSICDDIGGLDALIDASRCFVEKIEILLATLQRGTQLPGSTGTNCMIGITNFVWKLPLCLLIPTTTEISNLLDKTITSLKTELGFIGQIISIPGKLQLEVITPLLNSNPTNKGNKSTSTLVIGSCGQDTFRYEQTTTLGWDKPIFKIRSAPGRCRLIIGAKQNDNFFLTEGKDFTIAIELYDFPARMGATWTKIQFINLSIFTITLTLSSMFIIKKFFNH